MIFISEKTRDNTELQEMINKYLTDISEIENNIHMTKNQSRQDPLNYGIRINNRIQSIYLTFSTLHIYCTYTFLSKQ